MNAQSGSIRYNRQEGVGIQIKRTRMPKLQKITTLMYCLNVNYSFKHEHLCNKKGQ